MPYGCCWSLPESNSAASPLQILALENRVLELELCSEKVTGERDALRERLHALETSRKELADEYIILKSNYLALGKELDQEVRQAAVFVLVFSTPSHNYPIYRQLGWLGVAYPRHSSGPVRFVSCETA